MIMTINNLEELFDTNLQKLYDIESQLVEAIPNMANNAQSDELRNALSRHLEVTREQLGRIEDIAKKRNLQLSRSSDEAMMQMIKQDEELIKQISNPEVKDSAIMDGVEKVEHYEMAAYQSAKALAEKLEAKDIADTLDKTLNEEKQAADRIHMMSNGGLMGQFRDILP